MQLLVFNFFAFVQNLCAKTVLDLLSGLIYKISYDNAKVTIDLRRTSNLQTSYKERTAFLRYDSPVKSSETHTPV